MSNPYQLVKTVPTLNGSICVEKLFPSGAYHIYYQSDSVYISSQGSIIYNGYTLRQALSKWRNKHSDLIHR